MGRKITRKPNPPKTRSSTSHRNTTLKHATKKRHQKPSKDRSEHVRDALNRDMGFLYHALENQSTVSSSVPKTYSVVSLTERMQDLGRSQGGRQT